MTKYDITYTVKATGKQETAVVEAERIGLASCRVSAQHGTAITITGVSGHKQN